MSRQRYMPRGVVKRFENTIAVDHVDLDVLAGTTEYSQ